MYVWMHEVFANMINKTYVSDIFKTSYSHTTICWT